MFIIEKPYASELLIDTVVQNDWAVLDNDAIKEADIEQGALNLISAEAAKNYYLAQEFPLIYSNSEAAVEWILENLPESNLSDYIRFCKDKTLFREGLKEMFPDFYFESYTQEELKAVKPETIKFPVVVKPAVGYFDLGIHTVNSASEWKDAMSAIDKEFSLLSSAYPENVINSSKFIVEQLIEGEEFAIDAYYDRDGEPVILNIYQHPFLKGKNTGSKVYLMSTGIMITYMAKFGILLRELGKLKNFKNFPMHLELRVTPENEIIPIEINPVRFASWCIADIAKYVWGINVYDCFYNQNRPDWNKILSLAGRNVFFSVSANVTPDINKGTVSGFEYERYLKNFSHILEVRRIDIRRNPLASIVFGSTPHKEELLRILALNTKDFVS